MEKRLTDPVRRALEEISDGKTWDGLLAAFPYFSIFQIAELLWEALAFAQETAKLPAQQCRIFKGLAMGYSFEIVINKLDISNFEIQQAADCLINYNQYLIRKSEKKKSVSRGSKTSRKKKKITNKNNHKKSISAKWLCSRTHEPWSDKEKSDLLLMRERGYSSDMIARSLLRDKKTIEEILFKN